LSVEGDPSPRDSRSPPLDQRPPTLGTWEHVAVTLSGATGSLYVQGARVAQSTTITLNPSSLGSTMHDCFGRSGVSGDPYLDGQLDNVRIYSRALTAGEVQALFNGYL